MYDIGLTRPVYIFQRIIENMLDVVRQADAWIHLFVMTSDKNHDVTEAFFEEKTISATTRIISGFLSRM